MFKTLSYTVSNNAQTCKSLHNQVAGSVPLLYRSVRMGGVPHSCRSKFWLHLTSKKIDLNSLGVSRLQFLRSYQVKYEELLLQAAQKIQHSKEDPTNYSPESYCDDNNKQIIKWFKDIDVDVHRTCNKDMYAHDVVSDFYRFAYPVRITQIYLG